jgi:TRAP-type C4-dicarboxylate transport system, small permease component
MTPAAARPGPGAGIVRAVSLLALWLKRVIEVVVTVMILSFTVVALLAVVYRYVLNDSLVWSEEFIRYSLFWVVMLGAALLSYENGHLFIEALHDALPPALRRPLVRLCHALTIAFCAILAVQGYLLVMRTTGISPALRLPMRWVYAAMPVGSVAIVVMTVNSWLTNRPPHSEDLA